MPTFRAPDGTELAYHLRGTGEPLICLPGGPMAASAYLGDLGGLSAHRQLVLLDPRGTGDSAVPDDPSTYRCDRQTDDVEALRAHLGLERIDLLGHSAGGSLALLYAAAHPERLRSLVLLTPGLRAVGIRPDEEEWERTVGLFADEPWYAETRAAIAEFGPGTPLEKILQVVAPLSYSRWDAAARAHNDATTRNWEAAGGYYAGELPDPAAVRAALATLAAPVLVVAGDHDSGVTPGSAAALAELFPRAELAVQAGAAHHPWLDDPGAFTRTIAAFLAPDVDTVTVDGTRLAYRTWGEPDAPPVVLLHGRCGSSLDWAELAPELAETRRVYAVDLAGHGLSDWHPHNAHNLHDPHNEPSAPGRYSLAGYRDQLAGFLRALGLEGATVIGHSMGGAAAWLLAGQEPDLIGRLVLEEAPPLFPLDPPRPPAERTDEELDFDWPVIDGINADLNAPDPGWHALLPQIAAPTLLVGGGPGGPFDQDQIAWMATRIPNARLATIEAGHLVHQSRPVEFLAAVEEFGL